MPHPHRSLSTLVLAALAGAGLLAAAALACRGGGAHAGAPASPPPPPRQIVVEGVATLDVTPDRVDVTLNLEARHARPTAAVTDLDRRSGRLHGRLKLLGVPPEDIAITLTSIYPEYRWEAGRSILTGYLARTAYRVTLADPRRVARVLEAGTEEGVQSAHTSYRHSRMPEMKRKVRDLALGAARDKARQIATALGVTLGPAITATEGAHAGHTGSHWYWGGSAVANVQGTVSQAHQAAGGGAPGREAGMPDAIPLQLTMSVVFSIQ